jgi:hypothetical protein
MKDNSIIDKVAIIISKTKEAEENNYKSHGLIGIDVDSDGQPGALVIHFKGAPHETLGMIEHLMGILKDHKKEIQSVLNKNYGNKEQLEKEGNHTLSITDERLEELIAHLPDEIKQKVINLKKKLKEAFDNQDIKMMIEAKDELMRLKKEYLNDIDNNDSNESSKNDDFDINDFK